MFKGLGEANDGLVKRDRHDHIKIVSTSSEPFVRGGSDGVNNVARCNVNVFHLVASTVERNAVAVCHALLDHNRNVVRAVHYPLSTADRALRLDDLTLPAADVALLLHLLNKAWAKLVLHNDNPLSFATLALLHVVGRLGARAAALRAHHLLAELHLDLGASVKLLKGDFQIQFDVRRLLLLLPPSTTAAAKKALSARGLWGEGGSSSRSR